jgi:TIR domain
MRARHNRANGLFRVIRRVQRGQAVDFFISYTKADLSWAEWIAWQLEESGLQTILQAWDFQAGCNFVIEMDSASKQAQRTIAVLSASYVNAAYTHPEWFPGRSTVRRSKRRPYPADASAPAPETRAPTSRAPSIIGSETEVFRKAEQDLVPYVGPVAKVLVRRALAKAGTMAELYAELAAAIPIESERQKFSALRPIDPGLEHPGRRRHTADLSSIPAYSAPRCWSSSATI